MGQRDLNLKVPQFTPLAAYGHFGRDDVKPAWEKVKDLSHEIPSVLLGEGCLLGMGNPLLDMINAVEESVLEEYGLKANDAILADEGGKHKPLYEMLEKKEGTKFIPGGATQNSIRVAQWCLRKAKKDTSTSFVSYIGCVNKDDSCGKKMTEIMGEIGVKPYYHTNASKVDTPTGTCAVLVTEANRSLVANLAAANNYELSHLKENMAVLEKANVVYSAGFFITVCPDAMMLAAEHCKAKNKIYCLNLAAPFIMQVPPFKAALSKLIPLTDILFGNETEAKTFAETEGWSESLSIADIACKLSMLPQEDGKAQPRRVVITQGTDPTIVAVNGKASTHPIIKVDSKLVVDTNGAGDAYVGGFLSKLVQGATVDVCCSAGADAAAVIVQQSGCSFP